jgi:hypothetical protein
MTKAAFLWVALSLSALARCASSPDSLSEASYQNFFLGRKGLDVFPPELKHLAPLLSIFGTVVDAPHPFYMVAESHRTPLYFPMQKVPKIRFRMSSVVVVPVISSRGRRAP